MQREHHHHLDQVLHPDLQAKEEAVETVIIKMVGVVEAGDQVIFLILVMDPWV